MSEALPIYTIGHSTRTIPEFVTLLRAGGVQLVVDIRTVPRSRTNPKYNLDVLGAELEPYQIGHKRIAELGGLRKKSEVEPEINGLWRNQSFHNYADYALTPPFRDGLATLLNDAAERPKRSCARRLYGGDAIAASWRTICCSRGAPCSISWGITPSRRRR